MSFGVRGRERGHRAHDPRTGGGIVQRILTSGVDIRSYIDSGEFDPISLNLSDKVHRF
jgi:hypothetical protein